jgi:3-methylcrotonyl-CoA carboxylase beta subunit
MGMCVAGGGYLPVMCDHVLMTDGSGLFLAGPALVQAAIGQKVSAEELGGAAMHSAISGTVDFREPNDEACLARIRAIVEKWGYRRQSPWDRKNRKTRRWQRKKFTASMILLQGALTT